MARTRSKPSTKATTESASEPAPSKAGTLPPTDANPPKLFVLPKDTSNDARIVTLDNPANGTPSRYYFSPEKGLYEFTRIAAPRKECRSWLITLEEILDTSIENEEETAVKDQDVSKLGSGYVTKAADLFLATPIDVLFLILPALIPKSAKETEQYFLALEDHLEKLSSLSRSWKVLLSRYPTLKAMIEKRLAVICDSVEAGDETMYRISHSRLLTVLLKKAERMCKNGLPPSMEEKFIKTALEVPIMNIRREESSLSVMSETPPSITESQLSNATSTDSQTSIGTTSTTATSVASTEEPSKPALETPTEVPQLLRLRTALSYLTTAYLPASLRSTIQTLLISPTSPIDFTPLTTHLTAIAKLRSEALALRSISDNTSRKRGLEEDDEKMAEREEKKRKKEDDERKKKMESRGVKQLKKVDTSGMKKMSSFFTKAPKKV